VLQARGDALDNRLRVFGALRLEARQRVQDEHLQGSRVLGSAGGTAVQLLSTKSGSSQACVRSARQLLKALAASLEGQCSCSGHGSAWQLQRHNMQTWQWKPTEEVQQGVARAPGPTPCTR
jgi:hypothetical protein